MYTMDHGPHGFEVSRNFNAQCICLIFRAADQDHLDIGRNGLDDPYRILGRHAKGMGIDDDSLIGVLHDLLHRLCGIVGNIHPASLVTKDAIQSLDKHRVMGA